MEVAPGVYINPYVPKGTAFLIDLAPMGLADEGKGFAIHPDTWDGLPPIEREKLLYDVTHDCAERGIRRMERWLASK